MSHKAAEHMERDSDEERLLPHSQQTVPQHEQFYPIPPIPQPPHYGHPRVQVPGNAFIGPYPDDAFTGVHQHPYMHGGVNQMQQQVVVVGQQQPQLVFVGSPAPKAYTWHIVLSCIVFWCCGWICGAIAFALAVHARSYSASGQLAGARRLANLSLVASVVGIAVGLAALGAVIALTLFDEQQ